VKGQLLVAQVARALVLLMAAGLMMRTFQSLRGVDPGVADSDHVPIQTVSLPQPTMPRSSTCANAFGCCKRAWRPLQALPPSALPHACGFFAPLWLATCLLRTLGHTARSHSRQLPIRRAVSDSFSSGQWPRFQKSVAREAFDRTQSDAAPR